MGTASSNSLQRPNYRVSAERTAAFGGNGAEAEREASTHAAAAASRPLRHRPWVPPRIDMGQPGDAACSRGQWSKQLHSGVTLTAKKDSAVLVCRAWPEPPTRPRLSWLSAPHSLFPGSLSRSPACLWQVSHSISSVEISPVRRWTQLSTQPRGLTVSRALSPQKRSTFVFSRDTVLLFFHRGCHFR